MRTLLARFINSSSSSPSIYLSRSIHQWILTRARSSYPLETGGVLVGYWSSDWKSVLVTGVIGAGPAATNERTSFTPDSEWQADQLARLYEESGRRHGYLGDWHSHPNVVPRPSWRDRLVARKIARSEPARAPRALMLIAGIGSDGTDTIAGYSYRRAWLRTAQLKLVEHSGRIVE